MAAVSRSNAVFINCPFDPDYRPLFDAIIFAVYDLGFVARCALEDDDAGEVRLTKIQRIIEQCRFGIHDLSAVELSPDTGLPRFNMPLELGLFLGCKRYGTNQHGKSSLVLDREPYRYRVFISDISGQDIHHHAGDQGRAIREVRDWLSTASRRKNLPSGGVVAGHYRRFQADLPALCEAADLEPDHLTYRDLASLIRHWLRTSR